MLSKIILVVSIFSISNAAVLLWSNKKLEISPLKGFTDTNLDELVQKFGYPEVTVYKSTKEILPEFDRFLNGYHTAYNPNGEISVENATEIVGRDDLVLLEEKQRTDLSKGTDVLSVLFIPNARQKRNLSDSTTVEPTASPTLYRAKSHRDLYSILYSPQPLVLRIANSSLEFGEGVSATIDHPIKSAFQKLVVHVLVDDEKHVVQFSFNWRNNYWTLANVKIKATNYSVSLNISEQFVVPARFSYHCNGATVFSDAEKTTELLIFDMQVQPDSKDGTFGDVYDCVDFMTVPIWSGLFVTGIIGFGLIIALIAIMEIKVMDKFDNQKTKQLSITVAE